MTNSKLMARLGGTLEFYKGWLDRPKVIGAIAPTSIGMARKMTTPMRPDSGLPVLELGPGDGAITRAILERGIDPRNLHSVEYCEGFLPGLRRRYPGVNFIHGDASNISQIARERGLERFDVIISALPLLNFPIMQRVRLINAALGLLEPGRPLVQFSYGLNPPVPARSGRYVVHHLDTVLLNLPPARLWTYQQRCP